MSDKASLLVFNTHSSEHQAILSELYDLTYAPTAGDRAAAIATHGAKFRVVLTIGVLGLTADEIAAMPALELICCMGAGYELVDVEAARARGIALANGQGTNDSCVADHAFGLVIAAMRNFRQLDRLCREGVWRLAIPQPPNVSGKRMGILGLGTIGQKIAKRAAAFDMPAGRGLGGRGGHEPPDQPEHSPSLDTRRAPARLAREVAAQRAGLCGH